MKIIKILCSRLVITGLLFAVQLGWLIYALLTVSHFSWVAGTAFRIISILAVIGIVQKNENAGYKLAWVIPILLFPLFGGLLYLIYGTKRPVRRFRKKLEKEYCASMDVLKQDSEITEQLKHWDKGYGRQAEYVFRVSGYPVYKGSETVYYTGTAECYEAILKELKYARKYIFLEYFIVQEGKMWNRLLETLQAKCGEGVRVYMIYDDVGCLGRLPFRYYKKLERLGIHCLAFNPYLPIFSLAINHRDHRKLLCIDGHTVFTGGFNLADEYIGEIERFGYWKDAGIRVRGEAAWSFTAMFLQMWKAVRPMEEDYSYFLPDGLPDKNVVSDGYVQPYSDSPLDNENLSENIFINMIHGAREYIYLFTPYLVPTDSLLNALKVAAEKGVDVRIGMPGIPDKKFVFWLSRSYYRDLMEAGAKIYEYTPGFLHSKCFACDDAIGTVGSCNLDYRSLYLHFECGTVLYDTESLLKLKEDMLKTFQDSRQVKAEECKKNGLMRFVQAVLRCFAPAF
ncbi:cardiolipin synthase [Anaerolentibacter hominis]|uniref:cardiolipin synthase n=1 Tax=Anaerolentibacter hominis TaxID=3079009 RepID=UPI0031B8AB08